MLPNVKCEIHNREQLKISLLRISNKNANNKEKQLKKTNVKKR